MSVIGNILVAAALVSTSAALAAPSHLTDSQYIAAARCQGLFDSRALGSSNAAVIDKIVKDEGATRSPEVFNRADDARSNASREARNATATGRSALAAERDGACQAYTGGFAPHAAN